MIRVLLAPLLTLLCAAAVQAFPFISADGKTRDFPVVVSVTPKGVVVRESVAGKDIAIPWDRLDEEKTAAQNPWFTEARQKATAGETVEVNLGLPSAKPAAEPATGSSAKGDWTVLKETYDAPEGATFGKLTLSAYVHKEVARPRLAIVWVGSESPLASRGDSADFARRFQGALVLANYSGPYQEAGASGSGAALVKGLTDLFAPEKNGKKLSGAAPAIVIIGKGETAAFAWSLVCDAGRDVLAAVSIDGVHRAAPNAVSFGTPCLFVQTTGAADLNVVNEDMTRPLDLWRHYSTDGCRWCYANTTGTTADPLALGVAFLRDVAAISPYVDAVTLKEDWENNALKNRIPIPTRSFKDLKETKSLLGTLGAKETFRADAKKGDARNDLIWLPGEYFAKILQMSLR